MLYITILQETKSRYAERYIKFLEYCSKTNRNFEGVVEKHHILPESIFPEYKSFDKHPWNLIKLTPRQHFIAHWMLAKIYGGKMWYAFNMMKRVGHKSCLYEAGRKYISEIISENNTGRPKSEKESADISKRTKNTVVVKNKDGNMFRVSKEDPRYVSGELVFYRTGTKHKSETLEKMRDNSGIKGKKPFLLPQGNKIIYLVEEEGLSLGLKVGNTEETKTKHSKIMQSLIWVTEISTGKNKRIKEEQFDLGIYKRGRIGYKGWNIINQRRKGEKSTTND